MKTERRHELMKNDLAERMNRSIDTVRPYSSWVTIGLVVVVVALLGWVYFNRQAEQRAEQAWNAYYRAAGEEGGDEQLQEVAKEYPNTPVNDWAQLAAADEAMQRGAAMLLRDKSGAKTHLLIATERYRELSKSARIDAVEQRATFNLGVAYESLGQVDNAVEAYQAVTGELAAAAQARAETLQDNPSVRAFYDWYAQAEPPTPFMPAEGPAPGERPSFDVGSPEDSPFRLPSSIDDPLPGTGGVQLPSAFDGEVAPATPDPANDEPAAGQPTEPADADEAETPDEADTSDLTDALDEVETPEPTTQPVAGTDQPAPTAPVVEEPADDAPTPDDAE